MQHHTGPIVQSDTELVDPLVVLGAAAAGNDRIALATGIYILPLRHPLAVARSTCTVQEIAGGRFIFGLGCRAGSSVSSMPSTCRSTSA